MNYYSSLGLLKNPVAHCVENLFFFLVSVLTTVNNKWFEQDKKHRLVRLFLGARISRETQVYRSVDSTVYGYFKDTTFEKDFIESVSLQLTVFTTDIIIIIVVREYARS